MAYTNNLGKFGEDVACEYLKKKGFKILERNYKTKFGEIDIVAKTKDKVLVFVEVKSLKSNNAGFRPEDHFTKKKARQVGRLALFYLSQIKSGTKNQFRVDLVAVEVKSSLLTKNKECCVIRHYQNISSGL